jgi:hypothetical protein
MSSWTAARAAAIATDAPTAPMIGALDVCSVADNLDICDAWLAQALGRWRWIS